jgi:hypothetical protein
MCVLDELLLKEREKSGACGDVEMNSQGVALSKPTAAGVGESGVRLP